MKYTLLEMTQTILSSMDSDEVNSIFDTVESQQVARVIRETYFDIIERANLPEHYSLVNLQASGDATKPTVMYVPSNVKDIVWLKYDIRSTTNNYLQMRDVKWLCLDDFLNEMYMRDPSDTTINGTFTLTVGGSTNTFIYRFDKAPQWYTSFDDNTLIFDSYDKTMDTTLQAAKSQAYCSLVIPFTMADTFVPTLDEPQFPLLLNEAKSLAWAELKQTVHAKAEGTAKRGWENVTYSKYAAGKDKFVSTLPNYGRK